MAAIALPGPATTTVSGLVRRTVFNVRDYGATGDGTTNDTAAFTAAITAMGSGGTLFIPSGTYNANIIMTNKHDFHLVGTSTAAIIAPLSGVGLSITTCNRLRVENLQFLGGTIGVSVNGASDGRFDRLQFLNQTVNCVLVNGDGSTETRWSNCTGRNCTGPAYFKFTRSAAVPGGTQDVGGTYLQNVNLANSSAGTGIIGYLFDCVQANSLVFLYMDNCIADSMTGDAMQVNNLEYGWIYNSYFVSVDLNSAALNLNGCGYMNVVNNYISNYVTNAQCLRLQGSCAHIVLDDNNLLGRTTAIDAQAGITDIRLGQFNSNCTQLTASTSQLANLAGVNAPISFGVRTSPAGQAAAFVATWQAGDALPTALFGGNTTGNNQTAVQAQSDTGKGVFATSNGDSAVYAWNFTTAAPAVRALLQDAGTTDTTGTPLRVSRQSSGTAGDGFGLNIVMAAEDSTTNDLPQATFTSSWVTASHFSRKARLTLNVQDATAAREGFRIEASGAAAMLSFFGGNAVVKPTVTGAKAGNAALTSVMSALSSLGLVTDSTT